MSGGGVAGPLGSHKAGGVHYSGLPNDQGSPAKKKLDTFMRQANKNIPQGSKPRVLKGVSKLLTQLEHMNSNAVIAARQSLGSVQMVGSRGDVTLSTIADHLQQLTTHLAGVAQQSPNDFDQTLVDAVKLLAEKAKPETSEYGTLPNFKSGGGGATESVYSSSTLVRPPVEYETMKPDAAPVTYSSFSETSGGMPPSEYAPAPVVMPPSEYTAAPVNFESRRLDDHSSFLSQFGINSKVFNVTKDEASQMLSGTRGQFVIRPSSAPNNKDFPYTISRTDAHGKLSHTRIRVPGYYPDTFVSQNPAAAHGYDQPAYAKFNEIFGNPLHPSY